MTKYSEKLRDPRWQKKRLEIMNRDNFTCQFCGENTKTLNVHHFDYRGDPWEAPGFNLITLCEDCHEEETHLRPDYEHDLLLLLKQHKMSTQHLMEFTSAVMNFDFRFNDGFSSEALIEFMRVGIYEARDKAIEAEVGPINRLVEQKIADQEGELNG